MESMDDSSERLMMSSSQKKGTKLTLFKDLLHPTENLNLATSDSDQCPSDCESGISGPDHDQSFPPLDNGLIRVGDGELISESIKKKLVSSLSPSGFSNVEVEAIHRKDYSGILTQAQLQSFCIYAKAMDAKCGGNANVKYGWFGAPKNLITRVLSHGFDCEVMNSTNLQAFGQGICLSPANHPFESMQSLVADEDGLRHMLLCRVILGEAEVVIPGSGQQNPSSDEFDSGVDNLADPRKYVVWSSRMNTHILPEFVVSFRASSSCHGSRSSLKHHPRIPNSHWMPFATLIAALSKLMPRDAVDLIAKYHNEYKKKKIARHDMIQRVRHIAGDKLLMAVIKSYQGK